MMQHSFIPQVKDIQRKWYIVDAEGQVLGRLAVNIANVIRGRHKTIYTPHLDTGDFVVVINADKVVLTGDKEKKKIYEDFSGYFDGHKLQTAREVRAKKPERLIQDAVWGMLPHGRLGRRLLTKVKIYKGTDHPHAAQMPDKFPF